MLSNHEMCVRFEIAKCAREIAKCAREIAKCARETDATPIGYGHAQVNHLGLRTCDWTQRLKTLPRTRTRQSPRRTVMGRQHSEAHRIVPLRGPALILSDFDLWIIVCTFSNSAHQASQERPLCS